MKIGFSSLACPAWDLETIVTRAAAMGFDGVELRGIAGEFHLPSMPELGGRCDDVVQLLRDNNVDLVSLGTSATLGTRDRRQRARHHETLTEFIELAERLHCPFVRLFAEEVKSNERRRAVLARVVEQLSALAPTAARHGVTLLIENGGDFCASEDIWYVLDAVSHPALRCCWNPCNARMAHEMPTQSMPRLGGRIGMVHACDATFDAQDVLLDYQLPGNGDVGIARMIDLLRGMLYDGYVMFEWPAMWVHTLSGPDKSLPAVATYLRACVDAKQAVLSAYKTDKRAPKLARTGAD